MLYIFKTDVKSKSQLEKIAVEIQKLFPNATWNFDLEDCDNIFRIEYDITAYMIISKLKKIKIAVVELE